MEKFIWFIIIIWFIFIFAGPQVDRRFKTGYKNNAVPLPWRFKAKVSLGVWAVILILCLFLPKKEKIISLGTAKVNSRKGVILRAEPNRISASLDAVPFRTKLSILSYKGKLDTIQGKIAAWYQVDYKGKSGWVWSGFLEE